MIASSEFIVVGCVGSVYGVQGWVKIFSQTQPAANILNYLPWHLRFKGGHWQAIEVISSRCRETSIVVQFKNCHDRDVARAYTGAEIGIARTQLPPLAEDEYYWADLIGLTVVTPTGQTLGKITSLLETGANDVLVVKGDQEHLIPYLFGTVIRKIDVQKGQMIVNWQVEC